MKILIVEDEAAIARMLKDGLEDAGFSVDIASDGDQAVSMGRSELYRLIVLDLMLPRRDGLEVCRELRAMRTTTPILMLTARDAIGDRIKGLDMGADDYLPKPFEFHELLARARALIRRDRMHRSKMIIVDDLEIDCERRRVSRAGKLLQLSPREYDLLVALATHAGSIVTREMIQDQVWDGVDMYSNSVNVYVGMLRKKVDAGHAHRLIQTVHGLGYTLQPRGVSEV
jgi:DNA-binding response OmpR family regulator